MLLLPNGEVVSDEEEEYEGMPLLEEEGNDSSEELPTHEKIRWGKKKYIMIQHKQIL